MGIFSPKETGEWAPAKGDIVQLKKPAPELWDELKELEGRIIAVEFKKPPYKVEPTGRVDVVFMHNGVERQLSANKTLFTFVRKG